VGCTNNNNFYNHFLCSHFFTLAPTAFPGGAILFYTSIDRSIAFYTPIYYILKRRNPKLLKTLIKIHVFGNLTAVMLISIHYAQQMGRPAQFYPELGTGLALYIVMFILVATGFLHRFGVLNKLGIYRIILPHQNRFLHIAITLTFYIVIIFHALRNIGIL